MRHLPKFCQINYYDYDHILLILQKLRVIGSFLVKNTNYSELGQRPVGGI